MILYQSIHKENCIVYLIFILLSTSNNLFFYNWLIISHTQVELELLRKSRHIIILSLSDELSVNVNVPTVKWCKNVHYLFRSKNHYFLF